MIGIGSYIALRDMLGPGALESGGWWFLCLGSGFLLTYLIGMRPTMVWPLFPAAVLLLLSMLLFGFTAAAPLGALSWIVSYWPMVLVLIGGWLVFRDHIPLPARQPVAMLGGLALLGYGVLAAASTVAAGGNFVASSFGTTTPYTDTVSLAQPLAAGQMFSVSNPNGRTTIRAGAVDSVSVQATRYFSTADHPPEVRLVPRNQGLRLELDNLGPGMFFGKSRVDLDIVVPASARVDRPGLERLAGHRRCDCSRDC